MKVLDRASKLRPLLLHWFAKGWILFVGADQPWMVPVEVVQEPIPLLRSFKHRVITLDAVSEILTTVHKKHRVANGTWAHGTSVRVHYFGSAAEEMNAKLTNGEVQAKTNNRYTRRRTL
jgi:hypothetical protein